VAVRVAYLVNQYPSVSHSFIRREIRALERLDFEITRISIRGWDRELADQQDYEERERTRYVLRGSAVTLLLSAARALFTMPLCLVRALALAWHMSRRSDRPFVVHLVYLLEACLIVHWLREAGVEHLHAHFGTNSAEVAMLVRALGGPPWSFTAHGTESFDNPRLVGLAEKIRYCAFAVAVSSYGRAQIYRCVEPEHWRKVHVIHCGLDPGFSDVPPSRPPFSRRLVCVARLSPEKGHLLLLEAARCLAERSIDFQLILAGDGELRAELEAKVSSLDLKAHIRITGWISSQQVRDEILASRALVLPSLGEGLPVVIMEAMSLRRPVISTFVGGVPELIRPGENGWLVPAGDLVALTEAMAACLDTPDEVITRAGEAARKRVLDAYDVDAEAKKLGELFRLAKGSFHPDMVGAARSLSRPPV
jgi:glycosyltransferase involved in cell wall biosynthesis